MVLTGLNKMNLTLGVLLGLLLFLGAGEAQSNQDCCLSYTKEPLPLKIITGFTIQFSSEVCDINAIIFHLKKGLRACANPEDGWVKKHLHRLSKKRKVFKKISQSHGF
ncbi:C-C motif chemokine 20 [Eublepharis macularius]|uniref:C-C motif chemokine n=1 Tax=Eublepharis macularius TaxID=481883 RepID=A0AA97L4Q7_EUBMA|nr:C-C motif chemokine 20 [Eublepharis macularius]